MGSTLRISTRTLVVILIAAVPAGSAAAAPVVFVNAAAAGANSGADWADAFTDLQAALELAGGPGTGVTQIWVAAGTYKPTKRTDPADPRSATFQLVDGVAIYGGFAGGEKSPEDRDPAAHATILSGDLNGDDFDLAGSGWDEIDRFIRGPGRGDNAYHVVSAQGVQETTLLDGLTISGGQAYADFPWDAPDSWTSVNWGGGMFNTSASPTLRRCTFRRNATSSYRRTRGGGMLNLDSNPVLAECVFEENIVFGQSAEATGGAICNINSHPVLTDCVFAGNVSTGYDGEYYGGAIENRDSSPALTRCRFVGNQALGSSGGAVSNVGASSPVFLDCTFENNQARNAGGALLEDADSRSLFTRCRFERNSAYFGGAVEGNRGQSTFQDCTFEGNEADWGGALRIWGASTLVNCAFTGNRANGEGGAVCIEYNSHPQLTDCTFTDNVAHAGGAICSATNSEPLIVSCRFSRNASHLDWPGGRGRGGAVFNFESSPTFVNCLFDGNAASGSGGAVCNYSWGMARCAVAMTNCTFTGNTAPAGPTLASSSEAQAHPSATTIRNCILWDHEEGISADDGSATSVTYSDVRGGWPGEGNISVDPRFRGASNPSAADFRLRCGSPCIDAGDNSVVPADLTDLDGDGDVDEPVPSDLGHAARFVDDPYMLDSGKGAPPMVDLGAYESSGGPWRLYVNEQATGARDGTSWADAYTDLQAALDAAGDPAGASEIWVAAGMYRPSKRTDPAEPRSATFALLSGVAIYGGFAGEERELSERDPAAHVTTLSGDLQDDDTWSSGGQFHNPTKLDNAYHVVTGSADASGVLDGFTVTAGFARDVAGGGMYNPGSPTVRNCTFVGNLAYGGESARGGAMFNEYGSPTITDCTFVANLVDSDIPGAGSGGAISNLDSRPVVMRCAFIANTAYGGDGGAISNCNDELMLVQCTFDSNSALRYGGALASQCGLVRAVQCTFSENHSTGGGALYSTHDTSLSHCTFRFNGAGGSAGRGGAILNRGFFNEPAALTLSNCVFTGNGSNGDGGAIHSSQGLLNLVQCTFVGNGAYSGSEGNALACDSTGEQSPSSVRIANSILWDRVEWSDANEIWNNDGSSLAVTYSDVYDGWLGEGNLNEDPRFVDADGIDDVPGSPDDDLRLRPGSPCIDAGDNSAVPEDVFDLDGDGDRVEPVPIDWAGNPRFVEDLSTPNTGRGTPPLADMGALESAGGPAPPRRLYVDARAAGTGDGSSWSDALVDLQPALDVAYWGGTVQEIWVAAGTYRPTRRTEESDPRSATFQLLQGTAIYGGFVGYEKELSEREPAAHETILSGDLAFNDTPGTGGLDPSRQDNAYHVVTGSRTDRTAVLDSLIITGGNSDGPDAPHTSIGAAVGGGMLNDLSGSPTVNACTFRDNSADFGGAGMYNGDGSHALVTNCVFAGNTVTGTYGTGAGMLSFESYPVVIHCTFTGNFVIPDPEGWFFRAGGMASHEGTTTLTNCILWGNAGWQVIGADATYSCIEGGAEGIGNIDADPLFADADGGDGIAGTEDDDLRLRPGSPCIDSGDDAAVPAFITADLAGRPRRRGSAVDMGAYEAGLPLDADLDGDVDGLDLAVFQECVSGPTVPAGGRPGCSVCDLDGDGDVDQADFGRFQRCLSGEGRTADPACLD